MVRARSRPLLLACSLGALVIGGCAASRLRTNRLPHGNLAVEIGAARLAEHPAAEGPCVVVVFGSGQAVAIDGHDGHLVWRRPVRVFGPPVRAGRTIVVPVRGHRLEALDTDSGATLWQVRLRGDALGGIAAAGEWVAVTTVHDERRRAFELSVYSARDGTLLWSRDSKASLAVPALLGDTLFTAMGDQALVLSAPTGRERARVRAPALPRIQRLDASGRTVIASNGSEVLDLEASLATIYELEHTDRTAFRAVGDLEPGVGDLDGIEWKLLPAAEAGMPRSAVLLARKAVFSLRFDPLGHVHRAHWVYATRKREFVDIDLTDAYVVLTGADATISILERETGALIAEFLPAQRTPSSAAIVVGEPRLPPSGRRRPPSAAVVERLLELVHRDDARLVPAQKLALDLLWRHEWPPVRAEVRTLASAPARDRIAAVLVAHARRLVETPWGTADPKTLSDLHSALQAGRARRSGRLVAAARQAVEAGDESVVRLLGERLLDPAVDAAALEEIARTLRLLEHPLSARPIAEFVVLYHADAEVIAESQAMFYALDLLIEFAVSAGANTESARRRARNALSIVVDDQLVDPRVMQFIGSRLTHLRRQTG